MRKALAIESIAQIIIMVAVIVVGTSFLLKAFGIDIFGWLSKIFEAPPPADGKVLYVRMDPEERGSQGFQILPSAVTAVHAFTVVPQDKATKMKVETSGNLFFWQSDNSFSPNKCSIYVVREQVAPLQSDDDLVNIYEVNPGVIIDEDRCNNLNECIQTFNPVSTCEDYYRGSTTESSNTQCTNLRLQTADVCRKTPEGRFSEPIAPTLTSCQGKGHVVDCNRPPRLHCSATEIKKVLDTNWRKEGESSVHDKDCSSGQCSLLFTGIYRVKYSVFCGNDGQWRVCSPTYAANSQKIDGLTCTGPDGEKRFKWSGTFVQKGISITLIPTSTPEPGQRVSVRVASEKTLCTNPQLEQSSTEIGECTLKPGDPEHTGTPYIWEWDCLAPPKEGIFTIKFRADQTECSATSENFQVVKDVIAPTTTVSGPASFQAPSQAGRNQMSVSFTDRDSGSGLYKCYYSIGDESGRGFTVKDKERNCNSAISITVGGPDNQFADCKRTGLSGVCYVLAYAKDNAGNPKTIPTTFNPNVRCSESNQGACYIQIT